MINNEIERRWVVTDEFITTVTKNQPCKFITTQFARINYDMILRLRKCLVNNHTEYTMTTKVGHGLDRLEIENTIAGSEYSRISSILGESYICNAWNIKYSGNVYSLKVIPTINSDHINILELEFDTLSESKSFELDTEWCRGATEVTNDPGYEYYNLVRR